MKITNKNNLPEAFENMAKEEYTPTKNSYGATTILKPLLEIILTRRHFGDIEQDVSDMIWLLFGTAVHYILEFHDKTGMAEIKARYEIAPGYFVSGKIDLYNENTFSIEDYKTATVWKVMKGDFDDWRKQGLIYAFLGRKENKYVERLKFHGLLKDWTAAEKRKTGKNYPQFPVWTWHYQITANDMIFIEKYLKDKIYNIAKYENAPAELIPICSPEERWNTGDRYAVYKKKGDIKAYRVFDTLAEANEIAVQICGIIEKRTGEDRKCMDYCLVNKFCPHWEEKYGGK